MAIAQNISFFANGYNLAPALKSYSVSLGLEEVDASVLAVNYRSYEAGFASGTLSASGIFDSDGTDLDEIHDVLSAAFTDRDTVSVMTSLGTLAVGGDVFLMNACETQYDVDVPLGQLIMSNVEMRSKTGLDFGKCLASVQLNSGTTNGTAVDNAAASSNGGLFQVHLQNDDATDCDFTLQHSTDNSVWVDLATVTNLSDANSFGYATVAAGTTVSRYIRLKSVITGGNTTLVSAGFARR